MSLENHAHKTELNGSSKLNAGDFGIDMSKPDSTVQAGMFSSSKPKEETTRIWATIPEQCRNSSAFETTFNIALVTGIILGRHLTLGLADDQLGKLMRWGDQYLPEREQKCTDNYYKRQKRSALSF